MKKQDFLEHINEAEERVLYNFPVCHALAPTHPIRHYRIRAAFQYNFSKNPRDFERWLDTDRWHNARDGMTDIERRLLFLECFKNWCLVYKEYKNF